MIAVELVLVAVAVGALGLGLGTSDWQLWPVVILAALAVAGDLIGADLPVGNLRVSSSMLAIATAAALFGPGSGALVAGASIAIPWIFDRYPTPFLISNLVTYVWLGIGVALAFDWGVSQWSLTDTGNAFYLYLFAVYVAALVVDFLAVAFVLRAEGAGSLRHQALKGFFPVMPAHSAAALLAGGATYLYAQHGLAALAIFAITIVVFQLLLAEMLRSRQRADRLEVRAEQLAGVQMAMIASLLRALDLRDKMTARHSAAVARYAKEIAAAAGMSAREQELAHTAGLLHDVGKFILPDHILKATRALDEADWRRIRCHPYQGAQIVKHIDGYAPVGEIIVAHHERIDGNGYPRGLKGTEIPALARIIAVADTYDVMTARDTYREPISSSEAMAELRRISESQLDGGFVEVFCELLETKGIAYRHGEDADFETELELERRVSEQLAFADNDKSTATLAHPQAA